MNCTVGLCCNSEVETSDNNIILTSRSFARSIHRFESHHTNSFNERFESQLCETKDETEIHLSQDESHDIAVLMTMRIPLAQSSRLTGKDFKRKAKQKEHFSWSVNPQAWD